MPQDRYFSTGNGVFDTNWRVVVTIPKSQDNWVYAVFAGYLELLSTTWPWFTGGESTPEDAATIFQHIYDGIVNLPFEVGDIKFSAVNPPTIGTWLPCNGGLFNIADYPDLFAAIGTAFVISGDPDTTFRTPDLRGRTFVGPDNGAGRNTASWADTLGGSGGEESHILSVSETPSHSHSDTGHLHSDNQNSLPGLAVVPGEGPVLIPNPLPNFTGSASANITSTGGDGAHNNMQPSIVMYAYILADL